MEKAVIKSLLILISLSSIFSYAFPSVLSQEIIYRNGDWIRYEYVIKTPNETCVWIIKVTIDWVNSTHVKYSAGLERLVSGGDFCQSYTALLILGSGFESANPVYFNTTTPSSRRILINPTYTGIFDYEKYVVTYYKGILLKYNENATTPFVGVIEVNAKDTSIGELKAKITATTTLTESYPATQQAEAGINLFHILVTIIVILAVVIVTTWIYRQKPGKLLAVFIKKQTYVVFAVEIN